MRDREKDIIIPDVSDVATGDSVEAADVSLHETHDGNKSRIRDDAGLGQRYGKAATADVVEKPPTHTMSRPHKGW